MNGTGVALTSIIEEAEQHPNPVVLSFYKSFSAKPFNQQDEDPIRYLMSHFQRSLLIRRKMIEKKQERQLMEQAFGQDRDATVLLDETGRVLFTNRKAELMLRKSSLTSQKDQLCSYDSTENNATQKRSAQCDKRCGKRAEILPSCFLHYTDCIKKLFL